MTKGSPIGEKVEQPPLFVNHGMTSDILAVEFASLSGEVIVSKANWPNIGALRVENERTNYPNE
jgi:hypothetical protein